ncbi:transmembrane protein 198-like isoform X2 [Dreissena polymorpha]|uniref:Transmembrane protein 198 n=1 Tax=Dreissena polymorpha TaxID=45954 RepID=A0A9D4HFF1_DREPO|nr:transmembrane protein 198-like isoform X2 [Dreissena polymorpha]XP_052246941.1 transmembrane protein 198-like isoform X2 [Dreissena polymorpha]XP_052246947.1 transmembrane protein 198-like isoform X2 [Dreissena polymorpha]XP_052246953.1 transmembrane protein 198-like isoform X2 [Dreissena polymorpha]XP_052246954.1 transmembrane protein 198-like isoform X2 [Dreissena polymorpha]XP_052246955.1 transmembrane protein 198-like isoform X2 [Dreissena polymorpha]XP_052246956.1 transmembrane protei
MAEPELSSLEFDARLKHPDMTSEAYTVLMLNMTTTLSPGKLWNITSCDVINTNYDIPTSVTCAICFLFGILYTFFGYRCFKMVMFLTGFLFGAILVYLICMEERTFTPLINAGIALGAGILCGLLTMLVQYVGLFITGFNLGVSVAVCVLILLEQFIHPQTLWIPIGVLVGTGIIFALVTLRFQKAGTILGSSVFGGILMISCIDYFIEQFMLMFYLKDRCKAELSPPLCWYTWVILGCWPFCSFVGAVTQWKITGKGFNHRNVMQNRRCREFRLKRAARTKEKPRENPHQSRYRHLYKVRRVNGDVLSQNYFQTVQSKLSPSLRRMTPVPTDAALEPESTNTTLTQIPEV